VAAGPAFDLNAIGTTLNLATVAGKPAKVLLNAVPPLGRIGEEARRALFDAGVAVAEPMLHQLVAFSHAVNDGRTAQEFDPKSKAAAEVSRLFSWMCKQANLKAGLSANTKTRKRA
jgi:chromosome partitioning protein